MQVQSLRDDRIGSSINESEFDRWNAICWKMLSLNKHRINERVGRSGIHKGLQDHIRKGVGCQERVSESGFERVDVLRVRVFARGSSTQSSGHVES